VTINHLLIEIPSTRPTGPPASSSSLSLHLVLFSCSNFSYCLRSLALWFHWRKILQNCLSLNLQWFYRSVYHLCYLLFANVDLFLFDLDMLKRSRIDRFSFLRHFISIMLSSFHMNSGEAFGYSLCFHYCQLLHYNSLHTLDLGRLFMLPGPFPISSTLL